jgi:hypothetical protein
MKPRIQRSTFALALAAALSAGTAVAQDDARTLVEQVRNSIPNTTMQTRIKLTSSRGWEREIDLLSEKTDDGVASFIEVIAPQDVQGTRFLFFERTNEPDEQHVYVPLIKRAMRIADDTRKQAFLGSDFYVSDMVAPEVDAYDYRFVGDKEVLGHKCRLVEAVPKEKEGELYGKAVFALDPVENLALETVFYDTDGKVLKTWKVDKLEKVEDRWTIMQQTMENVQDKTTSTITITSIDYDVDLPGGTFSRERLLR